MPKQYDAIIIGAGAIGASIAFALAKRGWRTLNVDRLPTCGYGSTAASSAMVRPDSTDPVSLAMVYESCFYWNNWSNFIGGDEIDERGLTVFRNKGALLLKPANDRRIDDMCRWLALLQSDFTTLNADELTERFPFLSIDGFDPPKVADDQDFGVPNARSIDGGVFFPEFGYVCDPQLASHNIVRAAEAHGASFLYGEAVLEISSISGTVSGVKLENGEDIRSQIVVNAAGPHSANINRLAGITETKAVGTRAVRQEVADVPISDELDAALDRCVITDLDTGVYLRPGRGNCLLIGSEDPAADTIDEVDPEHFDPYLSQRWKTQVLRARQRIPSLRVPKSIRGTVELYDLSDDGLPIYDKSDLPGFYLAIGTSGKRFSTAPLDGELMADIIESCEGGNDQDSNPTDFHLTNIDYTFSSDVYSRLRQVRSELAQPEIS